MKKDPQYLWYRCPWCKKVPRLPFEDFVFQHMYRRTSRRGKRKLGSSGCDEMPELQRHLNLKNQLIDPFDDPKGERKEFHFAEPEEISPIIADQSDRFRKGWKLLDRSPETSLNQSPKKVTKRRYKPRKPKDKSVKRGLEVGGEYKAYEVKMKDFFVERSYHIPEGF